MRQPIRWSMLENALYNKGEHYEKNHNSPVGSSWRSFFITLFVSIMQLSFVGAKMVTIKSNFIADFNLGDNLSFNLLALKMFYSMRDTPNRQYRLLLQRPITILNVSILEAVLHDLHYRAKNFTREGVANIAKEVLLELRLKKLEKFTVYIDSAKSRKLFDFDDTVYADMHTLRKLRNRVHIQNADGGFDPKDRHAFSEELMLLSERTLEAVMRQLALKYARDHSYNADFILPWESHFP